MGKQKKEVRKSPIARRRSVVLNKSKSERDHQMQKVVTTPSADVDVVNNFGVAYEDETYSTRNDILLRLMVLLKIVKYPLDSFSSGIREKSAQKL